MPELPEVEVTRRGLAPALVGQVLTGVVVRNPSLRFPVPADWQHVVGGVLESLERRGKYLLFRFRPGCVIVHLGMSGSLRQVLADKVVEKHDHVDLVFGDQAVRLRDPRRFGAVLWQEGEGARHSLLSKLGIEPLSSAFTGELLHSLTRQRQAAIKQVIMDAHTVVGVGNIYASESLFRAGILPSTPACQLSPEQCRRLSEAIRDTLEAALAAGGSTLRDFIQSDGSSGYFQQQLYVYGRAGLVCRLCGTPILSQRQANRSTFYCPRCQS